MNYEDIQKVNQTLSTMDIKGKDYVLVNERIRAFRMLFPMGTIRTKILSMTDGVVTMQAEVCVGDQVLATGHAQEKENSTYINKTSYIENCETSAVGRALGMLGIGIDTSVASYEEVATAIANQGPPSLATESEKKRIWAIASKKGMDKAQIIQLLKRCGATYDGMTSEQYVALNNILRDMADGDESKSA